MKKHLFNLVILSLGILLQACSKSSPNEVPEDKFCLTDTLKKKIELATAQVQTVQNELILSGKVTLNEDKVTKVYPLAGGFVQELYAELGDYVQKGQVLAVIRSPEIVEFSSQESIARTNLRVADKNLQVAEELYQTGSISEIELINAQKEVQKVQGELNRVKEILSIYGATKTNIYKIKAPSSGFVVEKDVTENMEIRTENISPIFTISNLDNIWVMANVYESDINKIKEGYQVDITTISYPDKVFQGKIDKIFSIIDPESKVLKARIILSNKDFKLKPEMFANVIVKYADNEQRMAIPSKAVIFDKNKHFVMVYKDACKIETREVEIYKTTTTTTYLRGGLKEGEKIISQYQLLIYDALND